MEVTETAATEHTITLYNHIDMIASQGTGPYYCPECRTGLGYSMYSFRSHMGAFRGQCKIINAGKQFHRCQYCKTDFPDPRLLKTHNARFGGSCKAWQLSVNKSEDRYDFSKNRISYSSLFIKTLYQLYLSYNVVGYNVIKTL